MRRAAFTVTVVLLCAGCGSSQGSVQGAEAAADSDVCAYFAPFASGMGILSIGLNGSLNPQDEGNASPGLWSHVSAYQADVQLPGYQSQAASESDAVKQAGAIVAWCKGHGFGS